jgi:pimeloyl-ACP methyl ester carboxylesterase/DNA-binding SARP family transcriptional activator
MLCLLGSAEFVSASGSRPLALRPKALALLARLALVGEPQSREALGELLFPDAADPRDSLRWHLSHLRTRLPGSLEVDRGLISAVIPTDVAAFRFGVDRILGGDDGVAPTTLRLYRGDLCAGLSVKASADFDNWLYVEEDELRRLFRRAVTAFAPRALAHGNGAIAVPPLKQLTTVDPYFEGGHVLLIEALEAAGDEARARGAYDRYQRIVRDELNADPRHDLVSRYESAQPKGRELPLDELVPLREITMHIIEWPGGEPPILFVHGSSGHGPWFTTWGEALSPELRAVALDLRGHGHSDKPPSGYDVDDHVADVLQLIEALALERPIVLGHSLGGSIATFVADAAGDAIGGLVLSDSVVGDEAFTKSAAQILNAHGPSLEERFRSFEDYLALSAEEDDSSQWPRWVARSDRMELAPLPDGTYRRRALREALAAEWASVAERDALAALSHVTVPVLILHADAPWKRRAAVDPRWATEPYIDHATVNAQLQAAADARLYVSHGQHHTDLIAHPSAGAIDAVRAFANDIRQRRTSSITWQRTPPEVQTP